MKAALLRHIGAAFTIEDVPEPVPGPEEVLVRTRACGICRTDLHIQDGLAYVPALPHVPGHEPAGIVAAVGAGVTDLRVGQRVVPHLFVTCRQCRYCLGGREAQCTAVRGILGVTMAGGFAEYFKVPARNLLPLPESVPFAAGGLVSCAVITAVHAFHRARLASEDLVVVLGAGGIGLILVQLLRSAGMRVVAAGRNLRSLEEARRSGAAHVVSLNAPDAAGQVREFGEADGAACVFECVGTAATMKFAAAVAARCGQIVVVGEEAEFPAIDTIQIAQRELEIIGSRNGSMADAAEAIQLLANGRVRPPITRHFPLAEINEGLGLLRAGGVTGRLVIEHEGGEGS